MVVEIAEIRQIPSVDEGAVAPADARQYLPLMEKAFSHDHQALPYGVQPGVVDESVVGEDRILEFGDPVPHAFDGSELVVDDAVQNRVEDARGSRRRLGSLHRELGDDFRALMDFRAAVAEDGHEKILPQEEVHLPDRHGSARVQEIIEQNPGVFGKYVDFGQIIRVEAILNGKGMETERLDEGVEVFFFG